MDDISPTNNELEKTTYTLPVEVMLKSVQIQDSELLKYFLGQTWLDMNLKEFMMFSIIVYKSLILTSEKFFIKILYWVVEVRYLKDLATGC